MMRRLLPLFITVIVLGAFIWTLIYLYKKAHEKPIVYKTATPEIRDIIKKIVAPGSIVPRQEVAMKAHISGVISKLYVEPGDFVKRKTLLAEIQIIPDAVKVNQAEATLNAAKLNLTNAKTEFKRYQTLRADNAISDIEFSRHEISYKLHEQEVETAENNLQLLKVGAAKKAGNVANLVYSTIPGMVLEVPVKEGGSVIEANTFNEGTTIASVADMKDIIFQGRVDEAEVGRLKVAMPVSITVGALGDKKFSGALEYIAPKGQIREGTIEFEVRAAVKLDEGDFMRSNYSANADIIVAKRDQVLSLNEAWIVYDKDKTFVEIETTPQQFERRQIEIGLSDGIWVEVKSGISAETRLKKLVTDWQQREAL
ncbi:MAG: efflux RND transporter periplasmic adaptor subunit [Deltaproteobacteria bacterium]|nr:efflux RND transporter periplasmic adaptor subunit [Deltaproteobacteria bacterium]